MPEGFPSRTKLLFQLGALTGLAAGILKPYHMAFCVLLACVCLFWLMGCMLCRKLRREFAAARKYLILAIAFDGLIVLLPDSTLRAILLFAVCMLLYFSVALQCSGMTALAESHAPDDRQRSLPKAATRFEFVMIVFAAAQIIGSSAPSFSFLCDLVGMAAMMVGFFFLWRYFGGKEGVV